MTMAYGGERRDKKPFEPPPWEREAFERLAQRPRDDADAAAVREPETAPRPAIGTPRREQQVPVSGDVALPKGGPDIDAMIECLRGEEVVHNELLKQAPAWGGMIVALIGLMMLAWGAVGLFSGRGKTLALAASMALMCMGGFFGATGAWLTAKNLKRQGVL